MFRKDACSDQFWRKDMRWYTAHISCDTPISCRAIAGIRKVKDAEERGPYPSETTVTTDLL